MFNLFKRDLKLYRYNIILPVILFLAVMCAIAVLSKDPSAVFITTLVVSTVIIPFIPITIHWREISGDTLRDLIALPCSRSALISLRYIEVLLFSVVMLSVAYLGAWVTQSIVTHNLAPFVYAGRIWYILPPITLLALFAYPMPFMFRWDGKGFAAAFATIIWGFGPLIGYASEKFPFGNDELGRAFSRFVLYLKDHPGQATSGFVVLFLILFSISFLISLKSFSGRDF
jgi:hypothetical protein